ncbi:MAG TPA: Rv3654c family TadE-like protein [Jiangellaceae bacterium]|nr:Rv3654c family TadE-like protein [Jiangellaceae bacterium]
MTRPRYRVRIGVDRGAGSILVLSGVMVVLTALLVAVALGGGYLARHRAAAAADLAALAGAGRLWAGPAAACSSANGVARVNGAVVRSCRVEGGQVEVVTSVDVTGPAAVLGDVARRARAGPAATAGRSPAGDGARSDLWDPGWTVPLAGGYEVTARFGDTGRAWSSGRHTGLDLAAPVGTPVVAAAAGRVEVPGSDGRLGLVVAVDHGGVTSYYAHLSRVTVESGQIVHGGQRLGFVGTTGNTTGPHLHFEVRIGGRTRDPEAFLGPVDSPT